MKKIVIAFSATVAFGMFTNDVSASTVKVNKGDTLYSIARKNNLSVSELMTINNLKSSTIYIGQTLKTSKEQEKEQKKEVKVPEQNQKTTPVTYKVTKGDTLYSISRKYKISVADIQKWNELKNTNIYIGQILKVGKTTVKEESKSTPVPEPDTPTTVSEKVKDQLKTYSVVRGDTLYKIASQFGLTLGELRHVNSLKTDMIYVGQVLIVDKNATKKDFNVNQLIEDAKTLMGTPYLWAGTTPAGFDCSGFIQYVFGKQFVFLPRTTQDMWNSGTNASEIKVGDVVFFETYAPGPTHAGIYIGNGDFIHAGSSTGVAVANLEMNYYKERYLGFKRF